ncbi:hypothetical protein ACPF37_002492 [Vibrio cholerae]
MMLPRTLFTRLRTQSDSLAQLRLVMSLTLRTLLWHLLLVLLFGLNGAWAMWKHYYPPRKLWAVQGVGIAMMVATIPINPDYFIVPYLLSLACMHYRCQGCIELVNPSRENV